MLYRMSYCSVSQSPITHGLVRNVLMGSRFNNRRDGITGMLMADDSRFLQVLEGPESAVRALYKRIMSDPRHRCVVELTREAQTAERWYPNWSMGYIPLSAQELDEVVDKALEQVALEKHASWMRGAAVLRMVLSNTEQPSESLLQPQWGMQARRA